MNRTLSFKRYLRHSPERVWKALTDSQALSRWYLDNDFSPIVGHRFTFRPAQESGFAGLLCGQVILVDPPYRLVYRFTGSGIQQETMVTWSLRSQDAGTLLTLQHTGFNDTAVTFLESIMTVCPGRFLDALPDVLDTTAPAGIG
jgi:uncharacterized protein YndB with AHSA1/START domain